MYKKYIKRILDIIISIIGIVVLFPLMVIIGGLVKVFLGSPIFFKQERVGKDEKVFSIIKFRTMKELYDNNGDPMPEAQRETKFGNALRSTSLDELPELINILKGEMSIIGPRPLFVRYLPFYTKEERIRHEVRGGLTQPEVLYNLVNPTWDEQLKIEIEYVKNISFKLDVKIFFATLNILFKRVNTGYGTEFRPPLDVERKEKEKKFETFN